MRLGPETTEEQEIFRGVRATSPAFGVNRLETEF